MNSLQKITLLTSLLSLTAFAQIVTPESGHQTPRKNLLECKNNFCVGEKVFSHKSRCPDTILKIWDQGEVQLSGRGEFNMCVGDMYKSYLVSIDDLYKSKPSKKSFIGKCRSSLWENAYAGKKLCLYESSYEGLSQSKLGQDFFTTKQPDGTFKFLQKDVDLLKNRINHPATGDLTVNSLVNIKEDQSQPYKIRALTDRIIIVNSLVGNLNTEKIITADSILGNAELPLQNPDGVKVGDLLIPKQQELGYFFTVDTYKVSAIDGLGNFKIASEDALPRKTADFEPIFECLGDLCKDRKVWLSGEKKYSAFVVGVTASLKVLLKEKRKSTPFGVVHISEIQEIE